MRETFISFTAAVAAGAILVIAYLWPAIVLFTLTALAPAAELRLFSPSPRDWAWFLLTFAAAMWAVDVLAHWTGALAQEMRPLRNQAQHVETAVESALVIALFTLVLKPFYLAFLGGVLTIAIGLVLERVVDRATERAHTKARRPH